MLQLSFKLTKWVDQQSQAHLSFQTQVFHILKVLHITQELQPWTQMVQYGKEVLSMTVKFTERKNIKRMLTISKNMVRSKKQLPIQDSHMLQLSFKLTKWEDHQSQVLHSYLTLVSHTLKELLTTQVPQLWTQMDQYGKELPSTMARFM